MKLFLETALKKNYVAVLDHEKLIRLHEFNQADEIVHHIEALELDLKMIDEIGVGTGPGSYTGVRLGVVVAESMGLALNIPVKGISSLHIFERGEGEAVVTDARASGFYVLRGEEPEVLTLDEVKKLPKIVTPEIETLPQKIGRQDLVHALPNWKRLYNKFIQLKRAPIEILYLRKTQAEIEREK